MLGGKTKSGFQGGAFIILQVIRGCNIAVFLAVMAVAVLMMIYAKMPTAFQFFNDVSLAFVLLVAGLLLYTEVPLDYGKAFITTNWPAFGETRGFTWLGIAQILIGCHHLGALSTNTYNNENVPFQVWQAIMGSGIIAIAFGITNIITSFIFSNRAHGVSAREIRRDGATTLDVNFAEEYDSYRSNSVRKEKKLNRITKLFAKGSKPKISQPIAHHPIQDDLEYGHNDEVAFDEVPIDNRSSPIIPDVKRPPTALHPAFQTGARSITSRYSEASHLDRFENNKF
ncbi:hypothetical protein GGR52DRAFT_31785 [Hypoxylon sp. FL1284]|nr:hypothetical protein GGR52DRAFT_31785 [Hypoxylon sp. FL1284]